ncbi:hypothetical protein, partial [Pseudomonas syringae]|uniref:hypothetical protein n=1 Tax=Pseudomonas syringae TaxID=317 RepID=UPI0034D78AFF
EEEKAAVLPLFVSENPGQLDEAAEAAKFAVALVNDAASCVASPSKPGMTQTRSKNERRSQNQNRKTRELPNRNQR